MPVTYTVEEVQGGHSYSVSTYEDLDRARTKRDLLRKIDPHREYRIRKTTVELEYVE